MQTPPDVGPLAEKAPVVDHEPNWRTPIMAFASPDRAVRRAIGRTRAVDRDQLLVARLGDRLYLTAVGATWRIGISEDLLADLEVAIALVTADP